ncbi:IclR family transcriptional regulator [Streptomyces sp. NPDC050560]|uniref:IclR family transcriptional regulator n=1 Tax=Streptomyces sp. NPDC050560 TaxID=3365630 RepID=UPI0037AA38BB
MGGNGPADAERDAEKGADKDGEQGADGGAGKPARRGGRSSAAGNAAAKAVTILEAAVTGPGPRRLADIATDTAIPKASVHRILGTLVELGFVLDGGSGTYRPGPRALALAAATQASIAQAGVGDLIERLSAKVGHTVHMALRSGDHAVYSHKVAGDQPYQMASRIGMGIPLHCTGIGKCVLAHLPRTEVDEIVARVGLPARTASTLTEPARLHEELAAVRERGFAIDNEENEQTIRCIAAPVLDHTGAPVGGVSISTLTLLVPTETLLSFAPALTATAGTVSLALSSGR